MPEFHPYAKELSEIMSRRSNKHLNIKFRKLLNNFGYRRRTQAIVTEMHDHLNRCGLVSEFSTEIPYSLDERVSIRLIETSSVTSAKEQESKPIAAITSDFSDIAEYALSATVEVLTNSGSGSGFVIHTNGLVVTGRHVVEEDGYSLRKVQIRFSDERTFDGIVFRSHRQLDFALIWLLADGPFPTLKIGDPKNLRHAQTVLAIGAPSGLRNTVTRGIVSNPNQDFRFIECIQTDASIDHGNSGGPLVNYDGVVGITLWGLGNVDSAKFAVPIDYLTEDIQSAVNLGTARCLKATYCPACGYNDYSQPTWYCRNCGVQFVDEIKEIE